MDRQRGQNDRGQHDQSARGEAAGSAAAHNPSARPQDGLAAGIAGGGVEHIVK
jgi:hypothetical protein